MPSHFGQLLPLERGYNGVWALLGLTGTKSLYRDINVYPRKAFGKFLANLLKLMLNS